MNCKHCGAETKQDAELCPACEAEEREKYSEDGQDELSEVAETEESIVEQDEQDEQDDDKDDDDEDDIDEFLDDDGDEEAEDGAGTVKKRSRINKKLVIFISSLVLIVALGAALSIHFFVTPLIGGDEATIMSTFNRFNTAMQNGDIEGMKATFPPESFEGDFVPMFGSLAELRASLEAELSNDPSIDLTNDKTMIKSLVKKEGLSLICTRTENIEVDEGGSATLWAEYFQSYEGYGKQGQMVQFPMIKQNGRWYIDAEMFKG